MTVKIIPQPVENQEQRAASILNSKQDLRWHPLSTVLVALRKDPKKSELITGFDYYVARHRQFRGFSQ